MWYFEEYRLPHPLELYELLEMADVQKQCNSSLPVFFKCNEKESSPFLMDSEQLFY